jgi:hypothetical protein
VQTCVDCTPLWVVTTPALLVKPPQVNLQGAPQPWRRQEQQQVNLQVGRPWVVTTPALVVKPPQVNLQVAPRP